MSCEHRYSPLLLPSVLKQPTGAVWVVERGERAVVGARWVEPVGIAGGADVERLAGRDATTEQHGTGSG